MSRIAVGALAAILFAAPAFASIANVDTDGDGLASYDELLELYPDLTESKFDEIDTSDDNFVDEAELLAAIEQGVLGEVAD